MAKRMQQETLVLDEKKVKVSIGAARKVAEYASRAEWHFRRGNEVQARSLMGRAREVLTGCELSDDASLRRVHLFVANPPQEITLKGMENLRDNAMMVLEKIEKTYLGVPADGEVAEGD